MQNMYAFSVMDSSKISATWDWTNISVLKVISCSTEKQESEQDPVVRWTNINTQDFLRMDFIHLMES